MSGIFMTLFLKTGGGAVVVTVSGAFSGEPLSDVGFGG